MLFFPLLCVKSCAHVGVSLLQPSSSARFSRLNSASEEWEDRGWCLGNKPIQRQGQTLALPSTVASNRSVLGRRSYGCRGKSICLLSGMKMWSFECLALSEPVLGYSTGLSLCSWCCQKGTQCLLQGKRGFWRVERGRRGLWWSIIGCTSPVIWLHMGRWMHCREWLSGVASHGVLSL